MERAEIGESASTHDNPPGQGWGLMTKTPICGKKLKKEQKVSPAVRHLSVLDI